MASRAVTTGNLLHRRVRVRLLGATAQPERLAGHDAAHDLGRAAADRLPEALAPEQLDALAGHERRGAAEVERRARDLLTHGRVDHLVRGGLHGATRAA